MLRSVADRFIFQETIVILNINIRFNNEIYKLYIYKMNFLIFFKLFNILNDIYFKQRHLTFNLKHL